MKIFSKVRNKEDIKEIFLEYYDETNHKYFPDVIDASLTSLDSLDEKKEDNLIILSKSIDSYYNEDKSSIQYEIPNKINTIMTSAIFLDKFYNETSRLNDKEFLSLALFCSSQIPEFIEYSVKIYNKNVLNLLCSKFDNHNDRESVLQITDNKIQNKELSEEAEIIEFISKINKEDIGNLEMEMGQELADYVRDKGVKI